MHTLGHKIHQIHSPRCYAGFHQPAELSSFDPSWLSMHRPDAHWIVADGDRLIRSRCSLWWQKTPSFGVERIGLIGHYASLDDSSANMLLQIVERELAARGCTFALGPMDQNTWRDYRFVVDRENHASNLVNFENESFLMEPRNALEWPDQFARNGYRSVANYFSVLVDDLTVRSPRLERVRKRLADRGVVIRPIRVDHAEEEIQRLFSVARLAFADHLFYTEVSESDFLNMYLPLREWIREELVLVAEDSNRIVGFCFALPDLLQAKRGQSIDTVIVKTLGALPEPVYAGLGQVLLEDVHHRAFKAGFQRGIHALVRDTAPLRRISHRYGNIFREYALFGKELTA
jgi:GNAT superfamily N-acetyltransferase